MPDDARNTSVQELGAQTLRVPLDQVISGRIESEFSWLKKGGIVWIRTIDFKSALFWVRGEGPPLWLNPPDMKGLPSLSVMLTSNVGDLPDDLKAVQLAEAVRKLTVEPRGYVASQEFLMKHKPYLSAWLMEDNEKNRKLFADQCDDPIIKQSDDKKWKLTFRYFNPQGGVEQWTVEGDSAHVAAAKQRPELPDRTFRWPFR